MACFFPYHLTKIYKFSDSKVPRRLRKPPNLWKKKPMRRILQDEKTCKIPLVQQKNNTINSERQMKRNKNERETSLGRLNSNKFFAFWLGNFFPASRWKFRIVQLSVGPSDFFNVWPQLPCRFVRPVCLQVFLCILKYITHVVNKLWRPNTSRHVVNGIKKDVKINIWKFDSPTLHSALSVSDATARLEAHE